VTRMRTGVLLLPLGILAAAVQLVSARWGLAGALAGGFLCGVLTIAGMRALALESENIYLPPLAAAASSVLGLLLGISAAGAAYPHAAWVAPLLFASLFVAPGASSAAPPYVDCSRSLALAVNCSRARTVGSSNVADAICVMQTKLLSFLLKFHGGRIGSVLRSAVAAALSAFERLMDALRSGPAAAAGTASAASAGMTIMDCAVGVDGPSRTSPAKSARISRPGNARQRSADKLHAQSWA